MSNFRDLDDYNTFLEEYWNPYFAANWYSNEGTSSYVPTPVHNNEAAQDVWVGSVGPATNDVSTVPAPHGSTDADQMISRGSADHSSQMERSKLSAHQHTRSQGGNGGSAPHYMLGGAQVQHVGYPTPNFSRGHSQLVAPVPPPQAVTVHGHFQQKSVGYTAEHQHVRGNIYHGQQTTPFQATTAINGYHQGPGGMQSQWREKNLQGGTPVIQAPTYQQPSSMQHLAGRMMRAPAPSTLTTSSGASGSTGGTFSSVASDQGGLQPRSSYGVHEYMNAPYGQVSATSQQDQCSHCHTWIHTYCNACRPPAHYQSHGDHAAVGAVRIRYCPIHGCNRGPGSNRPFPRTCNLLEHLRGVHKEDIPRGAKLRAWLVSQEYDPELLVEHVKPRA